MVKKRRLIQILWAVFSNGNLAGFLSGTIYSGRLKSICLPGLNCYSCPGSLGSCPIGALQATLNNNRITISFYLIGFFLLVGTLFGRLICGFLCPFGLIQDLLHKIPFPKKIKTFKHDSRLRYVKYIILLLFVVILPTLIVDAAGNGVPWFCKWICPAGTLEGGLPLIFTNHELWRATGSLFVWKMVILFGTIIASIMIYRPFCKYICPLGAIYSFFNKISIYKYNIQESKCTNCNKCEDACPMQIKPRKEVNHPECIRCGVCKDTCKAGAISSGFFYGS